MKAIWIAENKYVVGPDLKKVCAIKKGDIRKVHAKKDGQYLLEGKNGPGSYFGWINSEDIKIIEE